MKTLDLSNEEILQFQYILPIQGDLKTLELVEKIINKVKIEAEKIETIRFEEEEIALLVDSIMFLDSQKKISFQSLPLIKKILNIQKEI